MKTSASCYSGLMLKVPTKPSRKVRYILFVLIGLFLMDLRLSDVFICLSGLYFSFLTLAVYFDVMYKLATVSFLIHIKSLFVISLVSY